LFFAVYYRNKLALFLSADVHMHSCRSSPSFT